MIGKPVQYADDKSRPYKVFGVPRKMLLEVHSVLWLTLTLGSLNTFVDSIG